MSGKQNKVFSLMCDPIIFVSPGVALGRVAARCPFHLSSLLGRDHSLLLK